MQNTLRLVLSSVLCAYSVMNFTACKKYVDAGAPKNQIIRSSVFTSDAGANSAISGIYSTMMQTTGFASFNISLFAGLSSDELNNYSTSSIQAEFYDNALTSGNTNIQNLWGNAYQYIYASNAILEGVSQSKDVTPGVKKQIEGEAKFIRAFCYFYLTNLFGNVPLITTTDYRVNSIAFRASTTEVYQHVVADLLDAQSLLPIDYSFANGERIRPNKWAATALLSRVYLYLGDWSNSEIQATMVISNATMYSLVADLNNVFLKNSKEAIWQLSPTAGGQNTWEGFRFILQNAPTSTALTSFLLNSFEVNDNRKVNWTNMLTTSGQTYYYPFKYKVRASTSITEYSMVFRLAEVYLNRSEARAQQNKLSEAIADLDSIRKRANLPLVSNLNPGISKTALLDKISHERQIEFFSEWGHRWLDLKRTNQINAQLSPLKPGWQPTDTLYPIPIREIQVDQNLTQNLGY